jgi:cob(I)alamin adenosyltransferase
MSIATRTGDDGTTGLMYNHRVSKTHPRVEACGAIDELNAALGMARSLAREDWLRDHLLRTQKDLVVIMGELATRREDYERYAKDGFDLFKPEMTARLDSLVAELESQNISFRGWATPGETMLAAALDLARTACRRAERRTCALRESNELRSGECLLYLNRLSDVLWLFARRAETDADSATPLDKQ